MSEAVRVASPAPDPLLALADRCVQCGLCLPACPTYSTDRIEAESPRGRIALARAWALEVIPPTPAGESHLDHCLGCRRCEAVCPVNVEFGALLVQARAVQRQRREPGWQQRVAEWLTARPPTLNRLLGLYRLAYPLLPRGLRRLPRPPAFSPSLHLSPKGTSFGARGEVGRGAERSGEKNEIAIFTGCVARPYEAELRDAVAQLSAALGLSITEPSDQTCCGTLHAHAGDTETAARLASENRAAFAQSRTVLSLASGCHQALVDSLEGVVDAIDFFANRGEQLRFRESHERVALHMPCTQRSVTRSEAATRALLARVPGLQVIELIAGHGCCGAAGTQMLTDPARAAEYRQPLLDAYNASGATRLLSANIGCRLHFANATSAIVQHPLEFLAECLQP